MPALALLIVAVLAAPTIDVRARTRLTITEVERGSSGVFVRGALFDAGTGGAVAGREIKVRVNRETHKATSGRNGRFDLLLPDLPSGQHEVAAEFAGDATYADARVDPRRYNVDKATLTITVTAPTEAEAIAGQVEAIVDARSGGGPEQVLLSVRVGPKSGPGTARSASDVRTARDGTARLIIPRDKLGRPGEKRIVVRFAGDATFNPTEAEATFLLFTSTQLSDLKIPSAPVRFEADVRVEGKLLDAEGNPVAAALVRLRGEQKRLADDVTDGNGRFSLRVAAAELGIGPAKVTIEHESHMPWRRGTRSSQLAVEVLKPRPIPVAYTFLAFGLTVGAVVGYVVFRTRPWLRVYAWLRRRRRSTAAEGVLRVDEEGVQMVPGLKLSRPGLMSNLRRPADHMFSGRVRDVIRGVPVVGARLTLTAPGGEALELTADADGNFDVELPPALWRVVVQAYGYMTEQVGATIPHRGELRGVRIDLLPVREKVFALYREVAFGLLPSPELWGVWTPREIFDHVRSTRPAGALGQFTGFVEDAYFSARSPGEDVLPVALEGARAARAELT